MTIKRIFAAAGGLAAVVLSGCAGMDWGSHLGHFNYGPEEKKNAVILIAGGAPEKCGANPTSIRLLADGDHSPMMAKRIMGFNSALDNIMYPAPHGVLMAMRVAPGHYRVFPYPSNAVNFPPVEIPVADITVGAGDVVYVGEMYLDRPCDFKSAVIYRDEFDRDMKLLKAQNPVLAQTAVQKRILVPRKEIP